MPCRILNFWGLHKTWGHCAITSGLNFFISKFNFIFPSLPLHCVCLAEVTEPKAFFSLGLFAAGSEENGLFVRLRTNVLLAPWVVFPFLFWSVRQLEKEKPLAPHDLTALAQLREIPEFVSLISKSSRSKGSSPFFYFFSSWWSVWAPFQWDLFCFL